MIPADQFRAIRFRVSRRCGGAPYLSSLNLSPGLQAAGGGEKGSRPCASGDDTIRGSEKSKPTLNEIADELLPGRSIFRRAFYGRLPPLANQHGGNRASDSRR